MLTRKLFKDTLKNAQTNWECGATKTSTKQGTVDPQSENEIYEFSRQKVKPPLSDTPGTSSPRWRQLLLELNFKTTGNDLVIKS